MGNGTAARQEKHINKSLAPVRATRRAVTEDAERIGIHAEAKDDEDHDLRTALSEALGGSPALPREAMQEGAPP